ncbi:MAG: hypothetical protein DWG77_02310 [Chloroflexi bacterium]|nr:hypothetical protein [Chloroflexota bacterium]
MLPHRRGQPLTELERPAEGDIGVRLHLDPCGNRHRWCAVGEQQRAAGGARFQCDFRSVECGRLQRGAQQRLGGATVHASEHDHQGGERHEGRLQPSQAAFVARPRILGARRPEASSGREHQSSRARAIA